MVSVADLVMRQAAYGEAARQERMRRAWLAYTGASPRTLRVRPGEYDDNVRLNFARLIVDKGVSFLFGGDVGVRVEGKGSAEACAWLEGVWRANRKATLLHRLAVNGAVCGHAFVKVTVGKGGLPRLVVLDPMTVSVSWKPDDWEDVVGYRLEWHGVDPVSGRARAHRQVISRRDETGWEIVDQVSEGDDARWVTVGVELWPHAWAPIAACQNLPSPNEYWGTADLEEDVLDVCQSLNFVLSNAVRIIRLHAHPKLWGSGFTQRDLPLEPEDVTVLPDAGAALHLLEMRGDLGSSLEVYGRLREALHEMARVPDPLPGGALTTRLSGAALRMLHQPLVEKTQTKRLLYGDMLRDLCANLLRLGGFGDGLGVTLEWPSVMPTDPGEEARTALMHRELGADAGSLLRRLGIDAGKEAGACPGGST
jgi:hypothetical protein